MTRIPCRPAVVAAGLLVLGVATGADRVAATTDPLACSATVHDPDRLLNRERLDTVITATASDLGADVRVRVEGTLDNGLDRRIDQLVDQCPGWQDTDTDELADDMVVVMFSRIERENSIFYGAGVGPVLEGRWDAATDAMIPGLRTGDYTDAVIAGLNGLTGGTAGSAGPSGDEGSAGVPGQLVFWVVVFIGVAALGIVSRSRGWTSGGGGTWDEGDDTSTGWFGGRRRRSSFSLGSFGSRSRSRSSGGRRSGGSRRAGGGTKKW